MMALPTNCANPLCREVAIKPIHCSSRKVAIDAVDGPPVFAHHVVYRCAQCGNTWAVHGYSSEDSLWTARHAGSEPVGATTNGRGW